MNQPVIRFSQAGDAVRFASVGVWGLFSIGYWADLMPAMAL
jgi:hypothetical protein